MRKLLIALAVLAAVAAAVLYGVVWLSSSID
jgi:hypothetical protein